MKFSILIPMYNVEKYIGECIDSCLNQTFSDFEIIIINDGSKDRSVSIVESYSDERIKLFHKENGGLLMARREAIPKAQGDYLIFLDSDDKLRLDALEILSNIIDDSIDKPDMVLYNLYNWASDTNEEKVRKPVFEDGKVFTEENKREMLERFVFTSDLNNLVLKTVKREIAQSDDTPYHEMGDSSYGEDKLQSFYLMDKAQNVIYSAEPLYYYRNNPTSITRIYASPEKVAKKISIHIEKITREYMKRWGVSTPDKIEHQCVRRLLFLRSVFFQCFNSADNSKVRREVVKYDWFGLVLPENVLYLKSKKLTMLQRIEINALNRKNYFILNAMRLLRKWLKG